MTTLRIEATFYGNFIISCGQRILNFLFFVKKAILSILIQNLTMKIRFLWFPHLWKRAACI